MDKFYKINKITLHLTAVILGFATGLVFRDFFTNHPLKKARMAFADYYGGFKNIPNEIDKQTTKKFYFETIKKYRN
jgi:hypothetical protein